MSLTHGPHEVADQTRQIVGNRLDILVVNTFLVDKSEAIDTTMVDTLARTAGRYADEHADVNGVARTPIASLSVVRTKQSGEFRYDVKRPAVSFVLQGRVRVTMDHREFELGAGETLLLTADISAVSQVTRASIVEPYLALMLELDLALIADLAAEMGTASPSESDGARAERTDVEVATAALRLMQLIRRPVSMSLLQEPVLRELHYWLLAGEHGPAIRRLDRPHSAAPRVARAVAVIRAGFAKALPVERLAAVAGMSLSAFHHHFRSVTSMTPRQFQTRLRLVEARRLLHSSGATASSAAYAVGYQSVSQFSRDYRRMFGLPPRRETATARCGEQRSKISPVAREHHSEREHDNIDVQPRAQPPQAMMPMPLMATAAPTTSQAVRGTRSTFQSQNRATAT
jgi:AraC-like DNA-binding protein